MTKRDKLLILAIIAVVALVAAHIFLSVDCQGGKSVISRVELKMLDPANNGINIAVTAPGTIRTSS